MGSRDVAHPIRLTTYSTEGMSPRKALAYWNEWVSDTFTQLEVTPRDRSHFSARLEVTELGYLRFANPSSSGSTVTHAKSKIVRSQEDVLLLHLQANGRSLNEQSGKEATLNNGDYTLCDSGRPYELTFQRPNSMLVLVIPRDELHKRLANPEAYTCIQMPGDQGVGNLVSSFVQAVWAQCVSKCPMEIGNRLADNILDLLATSYASIRMATVDESAVTTARRIMLRELIERNLADPELSLRSIAEEIGYSTSYLHQFFKGEGESISQYILRRRLEQVAKALRSPQQRRMTITEIALRWGFKNPTHFGRAFKQRYHVSPREYRSMTLRGS